MTKLVLNHQTHAISSAKSELIIAQQEKASAKEQFEMARQRLMKVTRRVQDLKAAVYFAGKEASHERA